MATTRTRPPVPTQDEELELYWEPRYHSYFYAGVMTPPTRQLFNFRGKPIMRPTDTHTWTAVHVEPAVALPRHPAAPSPRPVIIHEDGHGRRRESGKGRQISWNFLDHPVNRDGATETMSVVTNKGPVYTALGGGVCCAVLFVVTVLISVYILLRIFAEEDRRRTTERRTPTLDITTEEEDAILTVSVPERPLSSSFATAASPTTASKTTGRLLGEVANDTFSATNMYGAESGANVTRAIRGL
ncbi:uncharacterized protein LOC144111137 [Amblyomma americanum]